MFATASLTATLTATFTTTLGFPNLGFPNLGFSNLGFSNLGARMKRVFVVGCARSGTTLFQAMLSGHSEVRGFPETFYFAHNQPAGSGTGVWRRRRQAVYALQEAAVRLKMLDRLPWWLHLASPKSTDKLFLELLDKATLESGRNVWSEKTPAHIHSIERITQASPQAKFIHLLRDGRDVVASLDDIYRIKQKSEKGSPAAWPLEESIRQWNTCMALSEAYRNHPDHHLLDYERLVSDPGKTLIDVCDFLSLDYEPQMLDYQHSSDQILGQDVENEWRRDVQGPLKVTHLVKYQSLFTPEERKKIEGHLISSGRITAATFSTVDEVSDE